MTEDQYIKRKAELKAKISVYTDSVKRMYDEMKKLQEKLEWEKMKQEAAPKVVIRMASKEELARYFPDLREVAQ